MRGNAQTARRPLADKLPETENGHLSFFLFDVFKVAGNGEPILIEVAQTLAAARARVIGLQEWFPGDYLIVGQATGIRMLFTAIERQNQNPQIAYGSSASELIFCRVLHIFRKHLICILPCPEFTTLRRPPSPAVR